MDDADNVISVQGLSFAYPGSPSPTIEKISFEVPRGVIFGLLGPSGAGKSTIQRILTRQIRGIDGGRVNVFGRDLSSWDHSLFERVGVGFELPNHYPKLTALENLELFASFYQSETSDLTELLERVGLGNAARLRVSDFSKGMQVRLNLARALIHNPELLYLDEPTTGLDPTTAQLIRDLIADLKSQGKTIVLTTHNMHDADALCDEIGFLAKGKMRIVDTPKALKLRYGEASVRVTLKEDGESVPRHFPLTDLGQNSDFLGLINNGHVETIHSQEATLDKVFQIVTGESLDGTVSKS
ncbi:MAG: ABC transporter ATP-binding protein [Pseudomonadota bacterium]